MSDFRDVTVPSITGCTDLVEIGHGARATVYRAWQAKFSRHVAVKVLRPGQSSGLDEERRWIAAMTVHPNVVTVHEVGVTADGLAFLVMELLDGGSLADRVRTRGRLDWAEAAEITIKIASVYDFASRSGVPLRNADADDVMVSGFAAPKLIGLSPDRDPRGDESCRAALVSLMASVIADADAPEPVRQVLAAPESSADPSAGGLLVDLQDAQAACGRPPTTPARPEAPLVQVAPRHLPDARTVPVVSRAGGRRPAAVAALGVVLALAAWAISALRPSSPEPASAPPMPPPLGMALFQDDFSGTGPWRTNDFGPTRTSYAGGQYRLMVDAPGSNGAAAVPWRPAGPERRLSVVAVVAVVSPEGGRAGLTCGASDGLAFSGTLGTDGAWQIRVGGVMTAGARSSAARAPGTAFRLRLDCVVEEAGMQLGFWLDDTLLGRAAGPAPPPASVSAFGLLTSRVGGTVVDTRFDDVAVHRLA